MGQTIEMKSLTPAQKNIQTLATLLEKSKGQIARAVPKHVDADRLARVALTLTRTTPTLLECSPQSILAGVMMSAQLGLELGMIGHAYLVPFNNKKTGRKEAQFIIGYRGMIDLARRSGNIKSIKAEVVYENDHFVLEYGLDDKIEHVPWHCRNDVRQSTSGDFRGAYAVAQFIEGGHALLYMPKAEIDEHRARSKASKYGPWVTDYNEMAKKTDVRGIFKWLPISIEIQRKVTGMDETARVEIDDDMTIVPDVSQPDPFAGAEDADYSEEQKESEQPSEKSAGPTVFEKILAYGINPAIMTPYVVRALGKPKKMDDWTEEEAEKVLAEIQKTKGAAA